MSRSVPLALLLALLAVPVFAAPGRAPRVAPTVQSFDNQRRIDINDISMVVTNFGSWGYDLANGGAGLEFPRGSGRTALFAAGLWLGSDPRVAVSEYSSEFSPGRLFAPGSFDDPQHADLLVWKVNRFRTAADTARIEDLGAPFGTDHLLHHSWSEYLNGAVPYGAPWKLHRLEDTSTPAPGDSVDVPGPDVLGDQMLWSVYHDGDPSQHHNAGGQTAPLEVEVRQTMFAFETPGPIGRTVFLKFQIVNRGVTPLAPLYASLWSDPDLGGFLDDLVGVDVPRGMGFAYNATNADPQYGAAPPAIGVDLLRAPDAAGLGAFIKYINGTDPADFTETLYSMQGLWADGSPIVNPVSSLTTTFMHDGDPVTGAGWLDTHPADRRMISSSDVFAIAPGDSAELWAAIVVGQGANRLASLAVLRHHDDVAQQFFDDGFALPPPNPPLDPCLEAASNCPRTLEFWQSECAAGTQELTDAAIATIAADVNGALRVFGWAPGSEAAGFCALMTDPNPDPRAAALQQIAALAATRAAGGRVMQEGDGDCITLDVAPAVDCGAGDYASVAALLAPLDSARVAAVAFSDDAPGVGSPLDGANGDPRYGVHFAWDLFGSTLDPVANADSFLTVELRWDGTQKAYRYLRKEQPDGDPPITGRGYDYGGFVDIGVTAWDANTGTQLEIGFAERALAQPSGALSPDTLTIPTFDQTWRPDTSSSGGYEFLFVFRRPYSGMALPELQEDGCVFYGTVPVLYTMWSRLVDPVGLFDPLDSYTITPGQELLGGVDRELYELALEPQNDPDVIARYGEIEDCVRYVTMGSGAPTCPITTPVTAALLEAEAMPDVVRVRWFVAGAASGAIERSEGGAWAFAAPVRADASGVVAFEDRAVVAGARYGYRLRLAGDPVGETWVEVPRAHRLSLAGFRPNPAGETPFVAFTLPVRGAARVEVLDVSGRRAWARDLGVLEAGAHHVRLEGSRLAAGIYFVRLVHADQTVVTRGVLMR